MNNTQITVMNADGSGITPLTSTPTTKQEPTWSPDGTRLLFVANSFDVDGQTDLEIWVIDADGSGRTQLTHNTFPDLKPAWSPLGNQIAFVATRPGDTNRNIYVMDADGNGQTSITPNVFTDCTGTPPNPDTCWSGHDDDPAWSPDGLKIAYSHEQAPNGGGPPNIWTMDPSGANKDNLSDSAVSFINPAWSPQGDMLAAVGTAPATTNRDIWVMNSDGGGQTPIEPNTANDIDPDWGPAPPPPPVDDGTPPLFRPAHTRAQGQEGPAAREAQGQGGVLEPLRALSTREGQGRQEVPLQESGAGARRERARAAQAEAPEVEARQDRRREGQGDDHGHGHRYLRPERQRQGQDKDQALTLCRSSIGCRPWRGA